MFQILAILVLLGLAALIINGIICLCLSGSSRKSAVDVLLVAAGIVAVMLCSLSLNPTPTTSTTNTKSPPQTENSSHKMRYVDLVDYVTNHNLIQNPFITDYLSSLRKSSISGTKAALRKLIEKTPVDSLLYAKLVLVEHEDGKTDADSLQMFNNYQDPDIPYELSAVISTIALTQTEAEHLNRNTNKVFTNDDWYQHRANLLLHKKDLDQANYRQLLQNEDQDTRSFLERYIVMTALSVLIFCCGAVTVVVYLVRSRRKTPATPNIPANPLLQEFPLRFREVYAVMIAYFYFSTVEGLLLYWMQHSSAAAFLKSLPLMAIDAVLILAGGGFALWMMQATIFTPRNMSLIDGIKLKFSTHAFSTSKLLASGAYTFVAAMFLAVCASFVFKALLNHLESTNPVLSHMIEVSRTPNIVAIATTFATVALLAPAMEEPIFRGIFYSWLRSNMGVLPACLASGILFSAWHMDLASFVSLSIAGAMFAYSVEKTGSLVPAIAAHAVWNAWVTANVLVLYS